MRILALIIIFFLSFTVTVFAEPIKIGVIFADTGRAAEVGRDFFKAIRLIVKDVNQNGGILNRQIKLIEYDNFSKPLSSKKAATQAVKDGVVAVIGASWSSNSKAIAEVLQEAKIPMITPLATNPNVTQVGDYIFRTCFIDPFQGQVMADFAINSLKVRKAAVFINAGSSFSRSLSTEFTKAFRSMGGEILYTGDYLKQENDFTNLINSALPYNPDIVYLSGYSRDSGFIIKQSKKLGLNTIFLGGDGWNSSMYKYGGTAINGHYFTNHWHENIPNPVSKSLINKYNNYKVKSRLALGHDAIMILLNAIQRAGSIEPEQIKTAIAETKLFPGATGNISFNATGDPLKPAVILKFENEKTTFIKMIEPTK